MFNTFSSVNDAFLLYKMQDTFFDNFILVARLHLFMLFLYIAYIWKFDDRSDVRHITLSLIAFKLNTSGYLKLYCQNGHKKKTLLWSLAWLLEIFFITSFRSHNLMYQNIVLLVRNSQDSQQKRSRTDVTPSLIIRLTWCDKTNYVFILYLKFQKSQRKRKFVTWRWIKQSSSEGKHVYLRWIKFKVSTGHTCMDILSMSIHKAKGFCLPSRPKILI